MLSAIMREAAEDAVARWNAAEQRFFQEIYDMIAQQSIIAELNRPQLKIKTSPNWILYQRRCSNPATPF